MWSLFSVTEPNELIIGSTVLPPQNAGEEAGVYTSFKSALQALANSGSMHKRFIPAVHAMCRIAHMLHYQGSASRM